MRRMTAFMLGSAFTLLQFISSYSLPVIAADSLSPKADARSSVQQQTGTWDQPALRGQLDKDKSPSADASQPTPKPKPKDVAPGGSSPLVLKARIRKDWWIAYKLAGDPWLYKTAAADPSILEAICEHPWAAQRLAKNRHLGDLAECDHYLCRRLTRWYSATWALVKHPQADRVIALDPEGIYRAIDRDPSVASALAKNVMFNQMVTENPDLGKFIALHM